MTIPTLRRSLALSTLCLLLPLGLGCQDRSAEGETARPASARTAAEAVKPGLPITKPRLQGSKDPEGDIKIKDPGPGGPPAP